MSFPADNIQQEFLKITDAKSSLQAYSLVETKMNFSRIQFR